MKWIEQKEEFQKSFDTLAQSNIQGLITELNKAVGNYIAHGGVSQDPTNNEDYNNILKLIEKAKGIKNTYSKLNDDIVKFIAKESHNNDLSGLLTENGELQKKINKLEKIQDEMKVDVESAIARDNLLRTKDTDISRHNLFILDRPVRKGLIPYLWVISVLFIGIGLVIYRMTYPNIGLGIVGSDISIFSQITNFITSKIVLGSLLISTLIVILFLSLHIGGVI